MTPADIAALRTLLARAKAAGWKHLVHQFSTVTEHVWWTPGGDRIWLFDGHLAVSNDWTAPALSVAQVTAVLELSGALPSAEPVVSIDLIRQAVREQRDAVKEIVFGTNVARSLIYTERPETLVSVTAERIWDNLRAYFATGDWPDRRRTAAEIDAEDAAEAIPVPTRRGRRRVGRIGGAS